MQGTVGVEPLASSRPPTIARHAPSGSLTGPGVAAGALPMGPGRRGGGPLRRRQSRRAGGATCTRELGERLAAGPDRVRLRLQLPAEGDPLDDATARWPDDRELVVAGRLTVERSPPTPSATAASTSSTRAAIAGSSPPTMRSCTRALPAYSGVGLPAVGRRPRGVSEFRALGPVRLVGVGVVDPLFVAAGRLLFGSDANPTGVMIAILVGDLRLCRRAPCTCSAATRSARRPRGRGGHNSDAETTPVTDRLAEPVPARRLSPPAPAARTADALAAGDRRSGGSPAARSRPGAKMIVVLIFCAVRPLAAVSAGSGHL